MKSINFIWWQHFLYVFDVIASSHTKRGKKTHRETDTGCRASESSKKTSSNCTVKCSRFMKRAKDWSHNTAHHCQDEQPENLINIPFIFYRWNCVRCRKKRKRNIYVCICAFFGLEFGKLSQPFPLFSLKRIFNGMFRVFLLLFSSFFSMHWNSAALFGSNSIWIHLLENILFV